MLQNPSLVLSINNVWTSTSRIRKVGNRTAEAAQVSGKSCARDLISSQTPALSK